jgi:hypothetical protein
MTRCHFAYPCAQHRDSETLQCYLDEHPTMGQPGGMPHRVRACKKYVPYPEDKVWNPPREA